MTDGSVEKVKQWIRDGPDPEDGTIQMIVATWFHWRMYAVMVLAVIPLFTGWMALSYTGPEWAIVLATIVAFVAGQKATEVSPKYDVKKNY